MRPELRSMTIEEESDWSKDPESAKSGPAPSNASLKKFAPEIKRSVNRRQMIQVDDLLTCNHGPTALD